MVKNVAQIKYGITINISVSAKVRKKAICAKKKSIFGILLHVLVKMINIQEVLLTIQWLHVMEL